MPRKIMNGDKVLFKKMAPKSAKDVGIHDINGMKTVSSVGDDGKIYLEGHGERGYNLNLFYRVCIICGENRVNNKRASDKCFCCAVSERDRLYKKFKKMLSAEQALFFKQCQEADAEIFAISNTPQEF